MRCAHSGPCGHKACLMHAGKLQLGANGIHTPIRQAGSTTQTHGARHRWWWRPEHQPDMRAEPLMRLRADCHPMHLHKRWRVNAHATCSRKNQG